MSIKTLFQKLLSRKTPTAHLPYIPTPSNQSAHNTTFATDASYTETETDIHSIAGTSIAFGTQTTGQVDENDQARHLLQTQSQILGSEKLVTNIEPKEVAGQVLPGVAGVCRYCQAEAAQAFEANLISIQDAQIKSLYDTSSAARCEICGINTCSRHCRPFPISDGQTQMVCMDCQQQIQKQLRRQRIIGFLRRKMSVFQRRTWWTQASGGRYSNSHG